MQDQKEQEINSKKTDEKIVENGDNLGQKNEPQNEPQNESQQEEQKEKTLEEKISELQNQLEQANDRTLRALAEVDNSRRLAKQELEKTLKYSISKFASDLIVVVENFFLASANSPKEELEKSETLKNYANAINMTEKELIKTLEKHGVVRIFPLKEKFNHNFHEALSQAESDEEQGTVLQVIQAGYSLNDRLLKPALVVVAK
jgi:molecular chaperone GrpE